MILYDQKTKIIIKFSYLKVSTIVDSYKVVNP